MQDFDLQPAKGIDDPNEVCLFVCLFAKIAGGKFADLAALANGLVHMCN
jgi:hypothetical protein